MGALGVETSEPTRGHLVSKRPAACYDMPSSGFGSLGLEVSYDGGRCGRLRLKVGLDDCLLPEDHPVLLQSYDRLAKSRPAKRPRLGGWPAKHAEYCEKAGIEWNQASLITPVVEGCFPGLLELTARECDLLSVKRVPVPTSRNQTFDLRPSLGRNSPILDGRVGCQKTQARVYLTKYCRLMRGVESLHTQGIHYHGGRHAKVLSYPNDFVQHLAGNAFNAMCCAASLFASFCLAAHCQNQCIRMRVAVTLRPWSDKPVALADNLDCDVDEVMGF